MRPKDQSQPGAGSAGVYVNTVVRSTWCFVHRGGSSEPAREDALFRRSVCLLSGACSGQPVSLFSHLSGPRTTAFMCHGLWEAGLSACTTCDQSLAPALAWGFTEPPGPGLPSLGLWRGGMLLLLEEGGVEVKRGLQVLDLLLSLGKSSPPALCFVSSPVRSGS